MANGSVPRVRPASRYTATTMCNLLTPSERWHSPPFRPEVRDERIWRRGGSDGKAPSSTALETIAAFCAVEGTLPINLKVLPEHEEEAASVTLPSILVNLRDLLAARVRVRTFIDHLRRPALACRSRGMLRAGLPATMQRAMLVLSVLSFIPSPRSATP